MCEIEGSNTVDLGIDLSEFYMSVEWDILEVPAVRYTHCCQVHTAVRYTLLSGTHCCQVHTAVRYTLLSGAHCC
jgi:hypothetical protein